MGREDWMIMGNYLENCQLKPDNPRVWFMQPHLSQQCRLIEQGSGVQKFSAILIDLGNYCLGLFFIPALFGYSFFSWRAVYWTDVFLDLPTLAWKAIPISVAISILRKLG